MARKPAVPADTIVLIHGLWMTPLCWENWEHRYLDAGYRTMAPSWPGLEGRDVADIRRDPSVLDGVGITELVDHYAAIIAELDRPPIIMGHSFGGLFTQILLDRGLGAAGVAVDPGQPKGVLRLPLSTLRSSWPVLGNPANRHRTVALTPEQFHYGFANSLSEEDSRAAYDRYHIPGAGRLLFQAGLANVTPHAASTVDFTNSDRAPLLIIAGGADHIVPPSVNRENARRYRRSRAVTAYREYPGRCHYTLGQDGWEEVADFALEWARNPIPAEL